ncbi:hypothetical protein HQQ94_14000 [Shewanella sp. VB17]|uniref:hypothetical protein n=1 Tax=Shewanella sp. VB17 TaxID=2739432 RepID=UPI001566971A|nr:hypothetical protein [Shewanella sp. VB17]NRD74323.1 hypothetical protein [Shewanella sp. VB17]
MLIQGVTGISILLSVTTDNFYVVAELMVTVYLMIIRIFEVVGTFSGNEVT